MKIEEYVPKDKRREAVRKNVFAPFVLCIPGEGKLAAEVEKPETEEIRAKRMQRKKNLESILERAESNGKERQEQGVLPFIPTDEEATNLLRKQGLIREYTENLKKIDLADIEMTIKELQEDHILQKYQYFVGEC